MKQTKHIRRLWGLMLLLIAMLMPQGVWAASHYDAGYDNTETTYSADGIKFKVVYLRMYNYQGNNSHFSNNPLVTITAGGHTHTFHLGDLCGESGNRTFYYNGEGNEDPYKGSGRFSKNTYKQTVDGIPVTAYFDNQRNDKSVSGSGNGGSSKWCTADLTIEIGVQTAATVNISGQWRDWSDGVNTNSENYSWNFSIDKHTCNSDTESTASTYIKDNATCTAAAVYYKSCSWCGEAQSDIFTSGNALGHSISGGKCSRCSHGFIYYTSTNNAVVTPKRANFGTSVDVVDNTYSNGQGVIETSAPVTQIGDECFYHKNALKSIQIPATVTSIGRYAFTSCTGLTGTLVIPDAVTSIGNDAFELCSTLSGVTFGSSLQSIGEYAFTSCSKLSGTLTLPASLTTIGKAAFQYCSGFTGNLTIPNKVTTIGEDAFDSCSGLTGTLTLPASVTTLQAYSFSKCPFTTVRLEKNSMYAWANYVFDGLSSKGTLLVPSNLVKTYQANKYWLGAFKTITCITHNIQSVAQKATSCTVDGNTAHYKCSGCDALFTNSAGTATTTLAAVTVKATGHGKTKKYAASYAWEGNASDPTCTFTLKCLDCQADVVNQPLYTTAGTYGSFSATTTPAKCTEEGVVTCQAAGKYTDPNGKNASYTETTTSNSTNTQTYAIAAFGHGHKGYTPSYAWIGTADDPTCTFTLFCEECKTNVVNEVLTTDAAAANGFYAQTAHVDEGCTDAGYTTYAATGKYPATSPSVAYTEQTPNVKTYGITAHGHDYADAVWTWADDGHSATCSRTCEYCGDEQKADVNLEGGISSEETQHATCTTKGVHTYTATATVKDKTYTDVKEVDDIEALDHLFGEGSWEWANNEADCAAFCTVVCEREGCGARMTNSAIFGRGLTAEVTTPPTCTTKGVHTYTAIAVMPGAKRTDVREFEDIPALGHGHQGYTPSYAWTGTAADPICKFRLFCEDCQTAVVDEELILGLEAAGGYYTQTDHHDATCTDRGSTTYAAMGQYDAEAPSVVYTEEHPDIHIYEISALGHNYADAVWTWADDGHSATCTRTCSVCSDEQHADVTLGNGITSQVVTPATCSAAGNTLYSAIATVKDEEYNSTKMVDGDVATLPHTFADNDTRHELCTVCHHTLFHYTSSRANSPVWINPSNKNYDADDNVLKVVSNTCDADRHGIIEYNGTLVRIGQYGFSGSLFAGTLVIPSTVTTIDQFAFTGDDSFTSVEFGPNLTTIGQFAFSDCSSLTGTIVIPDAVTSVGLSAFYNCNINNLVARCQLDLRSCGVYEYQITRTHEFTDRVSA
ncbi:MAG: leucine-rich repeat domain-containing protein [Bacteroidales bacterium]|nr:leucine-rich repeat domain-containing protein [Bacteroidales bacterium]